jgi:hypothetical protein
MLHRNSGEKSLYGQGVLHSIFRVVPRNCTASRFPQSVAWFNRSLETSTTGFDCCLSQKILDGGTGVQTTSVEGFDFREAVDPVAQLALPEVVECLDMADHSTFRVAGCNEIMRASRLSVGVIIAITSLPHAYT